MTDDASGGRDEAAQDDAAHDEAAQDAVERIEDARSEAAAYVVQRQPLEPGDIGAAEERIVDAVERAVEEEDPRALERLVEQAEDGRDEIRSELYGKGSERRS